MNKIVFILLFTLCLSKCFSQNNVNIGGSSPNAWLNSGGGLKNDSMFRHAIAPDSNSRYSTEAATRYFTNTHSLWYKTNISWTEQLSKLKSQAIITSTPQVGDSATTAADFVSLFFKTQNPTATLTGGTTLELTAASTVSETLNWGAGRQFATQPLATIVVAGVTQSFSQPSAPGTVSGTQNVSVPSNTTTTYSNTVTTTDGKTATATTQFVFSPKRYRGLVSDTTGIGTTGYNDAILLALTNELTTSKVLTSVSTGTPSGSEFWVYLYPADEGALTQLTFNGFPSLAAMNTATRSFTNALGYTQNYILYWNKNAQTIASTVSAQ